MPFLLQELARPSEAEEEETAQRTAEVLQRKVDQKLSIVNPKNVPEPPKEAQYIKYTPSKQGQEYNSGATQRIIKMQEAQEDPLEPPKFRHKRLPKPPGERVYAESFALYIFQGSDPDCCIRRLATRSGVAQPAQESLTRGGKELEGSALHFKLEESARVHHSVG